jgi:hypothetical protein
MEDSLSNRDQFLQRIQQEESADYIDWFATVHCQTCDEYVEEQRYYMLDKVLWWKCSLGHPSMIENFKVF